MWEHGFPYNTMTCCIFSKETAVQDTKKISPVGKKMAEKKSDQKAGETHSLYCSNVYTPLYHALYQKHVLLHDLIASKYKIFN